MHHSFTGRAALTAAAALFGVVLALAPAPAVAQESGTGDVFGDLVHIKRSPETGQPILQKRWIEYPGDVLDWGYCPIPVDATGAEIPFADLSCDVDPTQLDRVVEVDYFGRLSGGRTREATIRMHFDEAIANMMAAEVIELEPGGRLRLGSDCTAGVCATWKVIDSPMENLALYQRLMKYGHFQTDPLEEDTSYHGDPATGTVYHPALRAEDWAKFTGVLGNLLPRASATECFGASFVAACAEPQSLHAEDFVRAASFLAGAADKHGRMTADLVQYFNRIMKITVATALSAATVDTLPALIRDENGVIAPAAPGLPAPADERFVDFTDAAYLREQRFNMTVPALVASGGGIWTENPAISLLPFLLYVNGPSALVTNMDGFVKNASDGQRAIEFIHEYAIPTDLYAVYATPTTTTVTSISVPGSSVDQTITLTAAVANGTPINAGTVTFTVQTGGGQTVGLAVTSGVVASGVATADYVLPGGTVPQVLQIIAVYSGAMGFLPSSGTGTLTVTVGCGYALTPASADFAAPGGTGSFALTTGDVCAWDAVSDAGWVTVTSAASGTGSATIEFAVAANPSSVSRTAHITVGGQSFTINQTGVVCGITVDPPADYIDAAGGTRTLNVVASAPDCNLTWNVSDNAAWLTTSIASGTDSQSFSYTAAPNPTVLRRTGVITVGSVSVTITQRGAGPKRFLDLDGNGIGDALLYDAASGQYAMKIGVPGAFSTWNSGLWATGWIVRKARFNTDAFDDLFFYNPASGLFYKALNQGDGTLALFGYNWATGGTPVVGDWNGDGLSDVLLYNQTSGAWFRGMSSSGSADFVYTPGLWAPGWSIYTGDFDGSGTEDLFLYNRNGAADANSGKWFRVMTLADGSFAYIAGDVVWATFWQPSVGDWNADGNDDLFLYADTGQWFQVFFTAAGATYVGDTWAAGWQVRTARFNADGRDDLHLYNPVTGASFSVTFGATGTPSYYFTQWAAGWTIGISDFTADGVDDVLLYNSALGTGFQANTTTPGVWSYGAFDGWPTGMTVLAN